MIGALSVTDRELRRAERRAQIERLNTMGVDALSSGRADEAAQNFEKAVSLLCASDDRWAPTLYENLGLAYHRLHLSGPALRTFMRALDGELTSSELSLRHAVTCLVNRLRYQDAGRLLEVFERAFGPHPECWTQAYLDGRLVGGKRRAPTYWSRR
jgi:hypothetical protein